MKDFYPTWMNMMKRCHDPGNKDYPRYGGRGVWVCRKWRHWPTFRAWCLETYQEGLTLDRKKNAKGYSPQNCRWATRAEQARNRDRTAKTAQRGEEASKRLTAQLHAKYGDPKKRTKKFCPRCSHMLPLSMFTLNPVVRLPSYCRPCMVRYRRPWR